MILRANVPCKGCTKCCQGDVIVLHPEHGDDVSQYITKKQMHPLTGKTIYALAHKANGECIYLGNGGCTIHERAPAICREFDCRDFYKRMLETTTRQDRRELIKAGLISSELMTEGRRRMHMLEIEPSP